MIYATIIIRTLFFYVFLAVVFRVMGKKEIGQLNIFDVVVTLMIAELSALSIEKLDDPILYVIVAISLLVLLQLVFSYITLKSQKIRNVTEGKPTIIINNGILQREDMKTQRYNLDDLVVQLREAGVRTIEEVEYAILEVNGSLSIFKYKDDESCFPMPLILDGEIQNETLEAMNKNSIWLNNELNKINTKTEDIFYGYYSDKYSCIRIQKKNDRKT